MEDQWKLADLCAAAAGNNTSEPPENTEYKCRNCGADDDNQMLDTEQGIVTCMRCGLVVESSYMPDLCKYSVKRRVAAASVYRRSIHFRERISQWLGQAPPVLHYARQRLFSVYEKNRQRYRYTTDTGQTAEHPLSVAEIRQLIHEAKLSQKQFAEKFVQIRFMLQGYFRSPKPTAQQIAAIESDFASIVRVWESYADMRGPRTNIINLNLIIATLILRNGGDELYHAHIMDFPTVGTQKWITLFRMLSKIARRIGWSHLRCHTYPIKRKNL